MVLSKLFRRLFLLGVAGVSLISPNAPLQAQTATGDSSTYYYAGGRKRELKASTRWTVVQLSDNAASGSVEAAARARNAVDKARATIRQTRRKIVALPTLTGTATTRQQLRTQLKGEKGVRRVLRTFDSGKSPIVETDEFLIRFQSSVTRERAEALVKTQGANIIKELGNSAPNGYVARVANPDAKTATDAANALYVRDEVVWSQPNLLRIKQPRFTPNDPKYTQQWHLNNTGQDNGFSGAGGTPGADVRAATAWDITRGTSNVIVAVIDDGLDIDHPDMVGRTVAGYDFISGDSDPRPSSGQGHGTSCAGVIAANGNNGLLVSGVAPNVKIMPIRLVSASEFVSDEDEANAFTFAADNGAHIISNSWGPTDGLGVLQEMPDSTRTAINYAVTSGRSGKGCVVFWAAGNGEESADLDEYAANTQVISVGASTNFDRHAYYSDFGSTVDICAPSSGETPDTLSITTIAPTSSGSYTSSFGGTSSATPLAAGVAALVLSVKPGLTATEVKTLLQNNADKIDTANGAYNASGHSDKYGHGRVNAYRALAALGQLPATYTVSGRVTTGAGVGVAGVSVSASTSNNVGTTDAAGNYSITGVQADINSIIPTKAGYTFSPGSRDDLAVSGNVAGINFTAIINPGITLTTPADNASVAGNTTLRAESQGAVQSVAFSRRLFGRLARTPGTQIPDATSANSPRQITDSGTVATSATISTAKLTVDITHSYIGDLVVALISPAGNRTVVHNRTGFDTPAIREEYNLSLSGQAMNGTWTLEVTDAEYGDIGTLNSWSLELGAAWVAVGSGTESPTGVWTGSWNTTSTTPGVYQVRAMGTHAGGSVEDVNTNIQVTASAFSIIGRIATSGGTGIANATLTLAGSTTTTTNSNGDFTFNNVAAGTYSLVPTLSGYTFSPASRTVTVVSANEIGQNFTGTPPAVTRTVSGQVTTSTGGALANVSVGLSGGVSTLTDAAGNFTIANVAPGTYTLTPALAGYTFSPASRTVNVTSANATGQNFTGTPPATTRTITGQVTTNTGGALANVSVALSGSLSTVTNSSGNFTLSNVAAGSYTLTPALAGYTFTPASRAVNVTSANATGQNFVATAVTYTLSGRVTLNSAALAGVAITAKVGATTVSGTTNSTGNYSLAGVPAGSAVVTPVLAGYTFAPATRTVAVSANVSALDFAATLVPGVTLTSPADNGSIGASTTLRAETRGTMQSVAFARRTGAGFARTPNRDIPDFVTVAGKVTDAGSITTVGTVAEALLTVNITHSMLNDLVIVLIAPDGTRYLVRGQVSSSATSINQTYSLPALAGTPMAGNWTLEVSDNGFGDTGKLNSWSLHLGTNWVAMANATQTATGVWTATWSSLGTTPGVYEVRALATHAAGSVADINTNVTVVKSFFTVSGRIATSTNTSVAGVSILRTGSATPVLTDANGNFSFTDLPNGIYTFTPTLAQYSFDPRVKSVAVSNANITGFNFVATRALYTIRGRVANHSGGGIPNVQVTRTGGPNAITDANGDYVFTVQSGNYTIAPLITAALTGVTMSPASRSITVSTSSLSTQNFTATFTVTGTVSNSLGAGIPNVQVRRTAGTSSVTVPTDASGVFRFPNVLSGNYVIQATVTPAMTGVTYSPATRNVTVSKNNLFNTNFIAWFSVSGRVATSAGSPIANVQIIRRTASGSAVSTFTDANGNYRFGEVRSGDYTLTAVQTGRTFAPATRSITVGTLNLTNMSFVGSG